jgi:hypothetical protein
MTAISGQARIFKTIPYQKMKAGSKMSELFFRFEPAWLVLDQTRFC